MEDFISYNPTKLIFGKNSLEKLGKEAINYGKNALILIGKGSVKKNGVLDAVTKQLTENNISFEIFEGIKSNPIYQDADNAVIHAKKMKADMVIAVGGGSVLDTAKAVCAGVYSEHSVWEFYTHTKSPKNALPLLTVLTLAATGSEMNYYTVIQNDETKEKFAFGSPLVAPKVSFLNPEYTYSVSNYYTACGVADLISHCLEAYFDTSSSPLSDAIVADIIRLAMEYGKNVVQNPNDYETRANIMWLATTALNGSLSAGKRGGDWGVHQLEHGLSALFDIAHGAGLSIVYPAWLKHYHPKIKDKLKFLAKYVLNDERADFIEVLEYFYGKIGVPIRLKEANIDEKQHQNIIDNWEKNKATGYFFKMTTQDYKGILSLMK
ncbi:MAG: iron-containing alcohol dehydrogenase [Bacteroidetes bacterium]|nr:MAG: iron-containing alcohol dehydrogenase [Bacteroidota bacterium]TAG90709.1 MAG: iron-containing alcohol dehydrogenase [Bacteroidota bacterium]